MAFLIFCSVSEAYFMLMWLQTIASIPKFPLLIKPLVDSTNTPLERQCSIVQLDHKEMSCPCAITYTQIIQTGRHTHTQISFTHSQGEQHWERSGRTFDKPQKRWYRKWATVRTHKVNGKSGNSSDWAGSERGAKLYLRSRCSYISKIVIFWCVGRTWQCDNIISTELSLYMFQTFFALKYFWNKYLAF